MTQPSDLLCALILTAAVPLLWTCGGETPAGDPQPASSAGQGGGAAPTTGPDPHSFARFDEVAVTHLALDLTVDFEASRLVGRASLDLDNRTGGGELVLDTRDLEIQAVSLGDGSPTPYRLGAEAEHLGRPLIVEIPPDVGTVHVDYSTRPEAAALQWLPPAQTAGGEHPFLLSQSQAILARTWIPLQDTPAVRMTYEATLKVPPGLLALMSAENPAATSPDGVYRFSMPQPIPSYLMAVAVGELEFRALGERSGVYAEPPVVEKAAWELADTPAMIAAAEDLYGPYRWGRYDILVLPPSFPFGGMENPRLTFATPTILAGDRSLTALVAHELAHSWSGNLVTNADWNGFWLNEGFTTYFEMRIMEELYGRPYSEMLALLSLRSLNEEVADLGADSPDTRLHLDLAGRDPDEGMNSIAYDKGYFFLRRLEEAVGRERWDAFLRRYFEEFAFEPMTSRRFVDYLVQELPAAAEVDVDAWVWGPGIPESLPRPESEAFRRVEAQVAALRGGTPAADLDTGDWSTHEWLHFLNSLPEDLTREEMAALDAAFGLTESGNSEILAAWFELAVEHGYEEANPALERFLLEVGRRKFLKPLYTALAETPEGLALAREIYARARPRYHAVSTTTIDEILSWEGQASGA